MVEKATKKPRSTTSAGLTDLWSMIDSYERWTFGTVAPSDERWPFAKFAAYAKSVFEGTRPPVKPGEVLLIFLTGCKRAGLDVRELLKEAAEIAAQAERELAEANAKMDDDGSPTAKDSK